MPTVTLTDVDVPDGATNVVDTGQGKILLCRWAGKLHAVGETCPHQRLSLDGARVRKGALMCPHHGARFDLATGRSLSQVTPKPLGLFPVREDGGTVEIDL